MATESIRSLSSSSSRQVQPQDDAMDLDAAVGSAVKRKFDEVSFTESPEEGRLSKRARLEGGPSCAASVSEQYFQQWAPPGSARDNPFQLIEIKVEVAEGEYYAFRIPRFALFKLSPHFKKVFSIDMAEKQSSSMIWRGPVPGRYIHHEAARYIADFAYYSCNIIEKDQRRTLAQIKADFPDEFEEIFTDIALLRSYFGINNLIVELSKFLCSELIGGSKDKIDEDQFSAFFSKYFLWAMAFQQQNLFRTVLQELAESNAIRIFVYPALIDLYEADYAECSAEEKRACQHFVHDCYAVTISFFSRNAEAISSFLPMETEAIAIEWDHACESFIKIFPQYDFDAGTASLLIRCLLPGVKSELKKNFSQTFFRLFCLYFVQSKLQQQQAEQRPSRWPGIDVLNNYRLLRIALDKRTIPERIAALENFLEKKHPKNLFALRELGKLYLQSSDLQKLDGAIRTFGRLLDLKAGDSEALMLRGESYLLKDSLDEALQDFNALLRLFPNHPKALYAKGECLRKKREYDLAILSLNLCLKQQPERVDALVARGMCLRAKGNFKEALKDFHAAYEKDNNHLLAVSLIADCYARKGEFRLANEYIDRALMLDPNDPPALQLKQWLNERKE